MRAAIYLRVSTSSQEERGSSLSSQEAACRALAATLGDDIIAVFQDVDSGYDEHIPGVLALTDAARRHEFERVIIDHPDRFSRNLTKKVVLKHELAKTGVDIRYVSLKVDDTAEGRLTENIFAVLSEYERERIAFRTNRGRYAKADRGLVVGTGLAPYGYQYTRQTDALGHTRVVGMEPDPDAAPIVAGMFAQLVSASTETVARRLDRDGVRPVRSASTRWSAETVLDIARNPVYYGLAAYGRRERHNKRLSRRDASEWRLVDVPAIVSHDLWERVQEALERRRTTRTARRPGPDLWTLRGRLSCAHCGGRLATVVNGARRYYTCLRKRPSSAARQGMPLCVLPALPADQIEAMVWDAVERWLLDPRKLRQSFTDRRQDGHQKRAQRGASIESQIERLRLSHRRTLDEMVDASENRWRAEAVRAKLSQIESELDRLSAEHEQIAMEAEGERFTEAQLQTLDAFAVVVRDQIEATSPDGRREIYDALRINGVIRHDPEHGMRIGKKNRFDVRIDGIPRVELRTGTRDFWKYHAPVHITLPLSEAVS